MVPVRHGGAVLCYGTNVVFLFGIRKLNYAF
jgi:hypothetical protein